MQPFNSPISDRRRQKFGEYMPRYEKESTMRPFDASISSYRRELFGDVMPRYETESSMRPFDAPISDWKRELFGTYMRRYEEEPSMRPFDAAISERSRELYGEYLSRWSTKKIAYQAATNIMTANGVNWVDMTWSAATYPLILHDFDKSMYQYIGVFFGGWAGVPEFRVLIDDVKVYPFSSYDTITSGNTVNFGSLSMGVRMGEVLKLQFRSNNAADGAGKQIILQINYATFE